MRSMRNKAKQNDLVLAAMLNEIQSNVAAMSVQDQDAPTTICFFPSPRLKTPSKPFQTMHIAGPPPFSARKPPTLCQFRRYQPFRRKFCPAENNKRVNRAPITTNAFNDCDPLLSSRSYLKLTSN